ncbi:hypothetical protein GGP78_001988 [Salinibacter ruber]|uniref:polysaccharide deacetylase family protein n=1 Tax=Salinibacter ruber TaxID=146919 RepID=UPI0021689235|nr:polysaccharide deacetylase family protein [Salinibacter ruber]MCS3855296.1 hypothetical protein [Salinibacter ruber]
MTENIKKHTYLFVALAGYNPFSIPNDIIKRIAKLITRKEEWSNSVKRNDQNFELDFAPYERQKLRHEPVIEETLAKLSDEGIAETLDCLRPVWPDGKRMAAVLTHDVDHLVPYSMLDRVRSFRTFPEASVFRKGVLLYSAAKACFKSIAGYKRWVSLDEWIEMEENCGAKSTFYFFGQPVPSPHPKDSNYRYTDKARWQETFINVKNIIKNIENRGWEVGLHGSYKSYNDGEKLRVEKQNLDSVSENRVNTCRQHYLRYDIKHTPQVHQNVGLEADTTLGSNVSLDFRAGTGLPFFMFDIEHDKEVNVLQVPLIIHDVALMGNQQMTPELALNRCMEVVDRCRKYGGAITVLWHNSYTHDSAYTKVYQALIEYLSECDAWGCTVTQMNHWWRKRRRTAEEWLSENY